MKPKNQSSILAKVNFEKEGKKETHYRLILNSIKALKEGCSKEIALKSGLDYYQVSRRLSELERLGNIVVDRIEKTSFYKTPVNIYKLYD